MARPKLNEILLRATGESTFVDAYEIYGVRMGDGFIDTIEAPNQLKDMVENESRLQHGKRVIKGAVKFSSRDLSLTFRILGNTPQELKTNKKAFYTFLYKSFFEMKLPQSGTEIYKLRYLGKNVSYGQNGAGTSCMITAKFEEPNPNDRT